MHAVDEITQIICRVGALPPISPDVDFYEAGFSSVSSLELLLELEDACDVKIPDEEFIVARSPKALFELIERLKGGSDDDSQG
jgi:acyl carrier protein